MRTLSRIERKPGAAEGQDDGRPHVQYNSDDCSLVRAMQRTDGHKRNAAARETFPGEMGPPLTGYRCWSRISSSWHSAVVAMATF